MPELPEVETIVNDLDKRLKGKKIRDVEVLDAKVLNLSMKKFIGEVAGATVKSVTRRAKMIIIELNKKFLLVHLKMTGQLVFISEKEKIAGGHPIINEGKIFPNKFTRAFFEFNGSKLFFNDVRRFGWIKLVSAQELETIILASGAEPLNSDFTQEKFKEILSHKKKTTVKQAIMDQKYLAGIGNIYADESLFEAGIRPDRKVNTLSSKEIKKLWQAIPKILKYSIKHRGTTFNDYVDAQGEVGGFIKYLKVYGRAGEKCEQCGNIVKKMKINGRGTHWCDGCQR